MLAAVHFYTHSAQAWVLLSTRKWPNPVRVPCLSPWCISAHSVIPIPVLRRFLTDLHLVLNIPAFSQAPILTSSSAPPSTARPFPPLPVFFLLIQTPDSLPPVPKLILDLASFQTTLSCVILLLAHPASHLKLSLLSFLYYYEAISSSSKSTLQLGRGTKHWERKDGQRP